MQKVTCKGAHSWTETNQMEVFKQVCQNNSDFETNFAFNQLYNVLIFSSSFLSFSSVNFVKAWIHGLHWTWEGGRISLSVKQQNGTEVSEEFCLHHHSHKVGKYWMYSCSTCLEFSLPRTATHAMVILELSDCCRITVSVRRQIHL